MLRGVNSIGFHLDEIPIAFGLRTKVRGAAEVQGAEAQGETQQQKPDMNVECKVLSRPRHIASQHMPWKKCPGPQPPQLPPARRCGWMSRKRPSPPAQVIAVVLLVVLVEGSLEVKLPTIWTDEKQSRAEAERRERLEERRVEEKESEERRCRCAKR